MRTLAATPYFARVPETQLESPQALQDREAAISVVAPASCISLLGDGFSNPADGPAAELSMPMLASVKRLAASRPAPREAAAIGQAAEEQYGHKESRISLPGNPRRPVGREPNGVLFLAAETSET
jgi:hypothetical protein